MILHGRKLWQQNGNKINNMHLSLSFSCSLSHSASGLTFIDYDNEKA